MNVTATDHTDYTVNAIATTCPNPDCGELNFQIELYSDGWQIMRGGHRYWMATDYIGDWSLLPRSGAKPLPHYVPEEIRANYEEACLILKDSPKASAAMSRRCLQGIVRDFWNIPENKRGNLGAEINYIANDIDDDTLESIKAVREVGDIGAHMEKAVDTIVDVEPEEAVLLVELIETLISDWYVARKKREERHQRLRDVVSEKRQAKRVSKESYKKIEDKSSDTEMEN